MAALDPVGDVGDAELRHRRDQHQAELHRRQHRHPQVGRHAEHHQQPVAAPGPERAKTVGEAGGFLGEFGERLRLHPLADDFQRRPGAMLAGGEFGVEPVERPVEMLRPRPGKRSLGGAIIVAQVQKQIARLAKGRRRRRAIGRTEKGRKTFSDRRLDIDKPSRRDMTQVARAHVVLGKIARKARRRAKFRRRPS